MQISENYSIPKSALAGVSVYVNLALIYDNINFN